MLELLFLLLPIAAGYGWYMGRRSVRQDTQKQSNQFSRQYVAGLNYLLSDESDKAVDLFIQLLEVDSETIETHLSLGNLFRQRGEVDRAIKIHQNLVTRQLTREQRQLALQELARDFLAAGLLDRAEALWNELCDDSDYEETALAQLLIIHQQLAGLTAHGAIEGAILHLQTQEQETKYQPAQQEATTKKESQQHGE